MRRSLRLLLLWIGLLMVALGSASAIWIGPDDTLAIGETEAPERARGVAVRTHPEITEFVNIDMLIRAKAEGGVFLGTSHRVDTESLLLGKRYFEITKMSLGNVGGVYTRGAPRATRKALQPSRLVGWLDSTTDPDWAELVVPLDGEPIDIIAVPNRRDARVTFSIGAHVSGLFRSQVAVALTGAVMIALSLILGWRARRREAAGSSGGRSRDDRVSVKSSDRPPGKTPLSEPLPLPKFPSGAPPRSGAPFTESVATPATGATARRPDDPSRWSLRQIVVVMLIASLALALSSCAVPGPSPAAHVKETRTGMSLSEAQEVVPGATRVYAEEFAAYPMWALVAVDQSPRPDRLHLLTRSSFTAKWKREAVVRTRGELPESVPRAIPAGQGLQKRADRIASSVADWWGGGEISDVTLDRRTRRARENLWASGVTPASTWVVAPPPGTPSVRIVEVSRGHLAILRHTVMTPSPRRLTTVVDLPTTSDATMLGSSLVVVD